MLKKAFLFIFLTFICILNAQDEISKKISFGQSEWEPLIFIQNQNASGMIVDYLKLLEKKTNLQFEYTYDNDWSSVVSKFQRGEITFLPGLISADLTSNDKVTKPFLKFKLVLAGLESTNYIDNLYKIEQQKLVVAIGADSSVQSYLKQKFPNIKTYLVNTTLEGLLAVETHKADLFLEMAPIIGYGIESSGSKELKIVGILPDEFELVMGLKDENLLNIINKGIDSISQEEIDSIYKKYIKIDIKEKIDYRLILYIIGGALFILLGFVMWLVILKNEIKRRKIAEFETQETNKKLLAMTELKIAIAKADSANQAKSNFLANMSHEIRTPMNTIVGMIDLVLKTDLSDKQKDYIAKVSDASYHLLQIINDILDYSKIEANKIKVESISFDMKKLIISTSEMITIKNKNVEFLIDISKEAQKTYFGDPLRIKQVLLNLLSNAVKFTHEGMVLLKVRTTSLNNGYEKLYFEVKDTGIGIKEKYQNEIFSPFSQADMTTTRNFGGTGLGLSISKRLIQLMGGNIGCESTLGKGSCFYFELNLKIDDTYEFKNNYKIPNSLKVLVVDDNENALSIFGQILASFDMQTILCNSSKKAIKLLDEGLIADIALLDWQIDDISGIELMEIINSRYNNQINSILMVTAYDKEELLNSCKNNEEPQAILVKPVSSSSLFDTIINIYGHKQPIHDLVIKTSDNITNNRFSNGFTTLVVEDNIFNQEIANEILASENITTYIVNNGEEAIKWLMNNPTPNIILMDCQMPIMDGYEATRVIRNELNLKTPIIAMTANALDGDKEKCFASGMNGYISKPFHIDDFLNEISRCVSEEFIQNNSDIQRNSSLYIDGLDVENALNKLNNNQKLYIKLLRKFIEDQDNFIEKYTKCVVDNDLDSAKRMSHTLKGIASTLGINELSTLAKDLELNPNNKELQFQIKVCLEQSIISIKNSLLEINNEKILPKDEIKDLDLQIDYLIELLKASDASAIEYGKFLLNSQTLSKIYKYIENFNFDEALDLLLNVKKDK